MLERVIQACSFPIAVIVAPAGYGKSVALRHYFETLDEPYIRFDVRPEHNTLSAFVRGFAEALQRIAPQASASLPDALRGMPTAEELASWLIAHLDGHNGLLAIDDLHYAADREIAAFLLALISKVKDRIRFIIATRSVPDLPIASWIAYGDMDIPIDERDLAFTLEETRVASHGSDAEEDELNQFVEMTGGWATALSFALRSRIRTNDLAAVGSTTREMVYRYLAEQVYDHLDSREREMLHVAAYLPEIDVELLVAAGFPDAMAMLERLRSSAAFLSLEADGRYRCHDLFKEFLRHCLQIIGHDVSKQLRLRVANVLLRAGQHTSALAEFADLGAEPEVIKVLEASGFDMADKCLHDLIDASLKSVSESTRSNNPTVLALRGVREAQRGRSKEGELLLRKAMQCATDGALRAELALRLTTVLNSRELDTTEVLQPLVDQELSPSTRGKVVSYLALCYARFGRFHEARSAVKLAEDLIGSIDSDADKSRILHRLGAASVLMDESPDRVTTLFLRSYDLAVEEGLYFTAAAALYGLANCELFFRDDILKFKSYCEQSLDAARKSGDRYSMVFAMLGLLHVECQSGNADSGMTLVRQITRVRISDHIGTMYLRRMMAIMMAWEGQFENAYHQSEEQEPFYNFDVVMSQAIRALYALGATRRDDAVALASKAFERIQKEEFRHFYGKRTAELARLLCAIVQCLAGRTTAATRILRQRAITKGGPVDALRAITLVIVDGRGAVRDADLLSDLIGDLSAVGYGGLARTLRVAFQRLVRPLETPQLTQSELFVLQALDRGLTPKHIAAESGRSVHTIRTLIQRATEKLGCSGRQQALAEARRQRLLRPHSDEGASFASA